MKPDTDQTNEDEIDPVEAVSRAVRSDDRDEYDGHALKQLIKNHSGVTLPEAGQFLLKALRSDEAPIQRDGGTFVVTEGTGADGTDRDDREEATDTDEDGGGTADDHHEKIDSSDSDDLHDETDGHTAGGGNDDGGYSFPDELRHREIWAVRDGDEPRRFDEAYDAAGRGESLGYYNTDDVVTVRIRTGSGDLDAVARPPFDGCYVADAPDCEGWHLPVVGYDVPDWWEDTRIDGAAVEIIEDGFCPMGDKATTGATVKRGGREIDGWLAEVHRSVGDCPVEAAPTPQGPDIDGVNLTDDQIQDALGYLDPDAPYPDWRMVGYALADNYDDEDKAWRVFEDWSRDGDMYGDEARRFFDGFGDGGDGVTVGYLIHEACLEGWVWEADDEPSGGADGESKGEGDSRVVEHHETVVADTVLNNPRRDLELSEDDGCYGYHDDGFVRVANFTLDARRRIVTDSGARLVELTVRPRDEEAYTVTVEPSVLNDVESFRDEVVKGFTTWFDGDDGVLTDLRARLGADRVEGTRRMGLTDDADSFVTPDGTLGADGWQDEPDTVFVTGASDVEHRWNPSDDDADVADLLELLPNLHGSRSYLTVLGWFYAAPLKPLIVGWEGGFPALWLTGDGRTAVEVLARAFGTDGEPLTVDAEPRRHLRNFAASSSVPVWYDGYRAGIERRRLDAFHAYCRKSARCLTEPDDGGARKVTAPVVVTGEKPVGASVSGRIMETELHGTGRRDEYARTVGESYYADDGRVHHPDGFDLGAHAVEYYSWITGRSPDELRGVWDDCLRSAGEVVRSRDNARLGSTELRGVRVTLFGLRMYQGFANEMGAEPAIDAGGVSDGADEVVDATTDG